MSEEQAIARYEGYLQRDPDNASLLIVLGDLYHRHGKFSQALACYEKCLGREPQHAAAKGRIASVMISQHRFEEAEQLLRSLTDEGEPDPALLHNLGITLYYQKRWAEALEAFQRARARGLQDAQNALYEAYALHRLGEIDKAAREVSRLAERQSRQCAERLPRRARDGQRGHDRSQSARRGSARASSRATRTPRWWRACGASSSSRSSRLSATSRMCCKRNRTVPEAGLPKAWFTYTGRNTARRSRRSRGR